MGKRSDFPRRERDYYPTPVSAVLPLIDHLPARFSYIEPCAGDGALVRALYSFAGVAHDGTFRPSLEYASDVCPVGRDAEPVCDTKDAFSITNAPTGVDFFITNPPWSRSILHPLILHLSSIRPTWLLFDGDWMHTIQAAPYLKRCRKIVSVGRVKWIPGSPYSGKNDCAWYFFDHATSDGAVDFCCRRW
jgi:hypothetical protein